ncbi:uncharacterized protein ACB058_012005 isoform 1-T2 [Synchiropus picturatus]
MSQSNNSKESQVLLQSMLQRLKLQPGRERLDTDVQTPAAPTSGNVEGVLDNREAHNIVTNGLGSPTKTLGFPAFGQRSFEHKGGESWQLYSGKVSFPFQEDKSPFQRGEDTPIGHVTQPFPEKSQDSAATSTATADDDRDFKNRLKTTQAADLNPRQGFKPRVYEWSVKASDLYTQSKDTQGQNGTYRSLSEAEYASAALTNQTTTNNSFRRKQRSSEVKPRRWTQKIKERWRERPGSLSKKEKEDQQEPLATGSPVSVSAVSGETTALSQGSCESPPEKAEKDNGDEHTRFSSDFEIGLGSFSLLDEIITGQEWAKFLHPAVSASATAHQDPPQGLEMKPQTSGGMNEGGPGNSTWSFESRDLAPKRPAILADTFLPVSMDMSEGRTAPAQEGSEPMEQSQVHQIYKTRARRQPRVLSEAERADFLDSSLLRTRSYLNRKRHHQSVEGANEGLQTGVGRAAEQGKDLWSFPGSIVLKPANPTAHPSSPTFPPVPAFTGPPPRGVLKHSISHESNSSMETLTKRRRLEDNRRVHFSEEVVAIMPPEPYPDLTDSEEDTVSEEDSVLEEDEEETKQDERESARIDEATPPRRAALPSWIKALKRRNTGRKMQ